MTTKDLRKFAATLVAAIALPCAAMHINAGDPAPGIDATLLDGSHFSLDSMRGKVVVVNFWATWCAPCRAEMPALDAYYRKHRDQGLVVLAISMDEPKDAAKARDVMKAFSFPAALAPQSDFKGYQRIWRLPLTFVIDRSGVLREVDWYGDPGLDESTLEQKVTPLLRAR